MKLLSHARAAFDRLPEWRDLKLRHRFALHAAAFTAGFLLAWAIWGLR